VNRASRSFIRDIKPDNILTPMGTVSLGPGHRLQLCSPAGFLIRNQLAPFPAWDSAFEP